MDNEVTFLSTGNGVPDNEVTFLSNDGDAHLWSRFHNALAPY